MHLSFFYFLFYTFIRGLVAKRKARLSLLDGKKKSAATILLSAPEEIGIGFLAGVASRVIISPLSIITVRLQTANRDNEEEGKEETPQQYKENSFSSMAKEIYNERGLQGFWKG